jgi:hypothetical protein
MMYSYLMKSQKLNKQETPQGHEISIQTHKDFFENLGEILRTRRSP